MPTLREIQRAVARSILANDDAEALRHIVDDAIPSADRLSIYRNNFTATLVGALQLSFPAVEKLVGREFFDGAVRAFIEDHPPRTACLNDYGSDLPDFLAGFPASAQLPYLTDVARLEWAVSSALNAVDAPALDLTALAKVTEADQDRLRFVPHPSLQLLSVLYPVDMIWQAVLRDDDAALGAIDLAAGPIELAVHRGSAGVVVRRLTGDEARVTAKLCSGAVLSDALRNEEDDAIAAVISLLADHLANGRFAAFETIGLDQA